MRRPVVLSAALVLAAACGGNPPATTPSPKPDAAAAPAGPAELQKGWAKVAKAGTTHDGLFTVIQDTTTGALHLAIAPDQLERYREAVVDDTTGSELTRLLEPLAKKGFHPFAHDQLKTAPRGYPKDHPRVELLRLKGLALSKPLGAGAWLSTPKVRQKVEDAWEACDPVNEWLAHNVGPSELPPPDLDRF